MNKIINNLSGQLNPGWDKNLQIIHTNIQTWYTTLKWTFIPQASTVLWPYSFTIIRHTSHDHTVMRVATSVEKAPYYNILYWNDNSIQFENVTEVQCQWKCEFQTQPPTCLTITRLCDKLDTHGTICDVHRGRSRRPLTATSPASSAMFLERFTMSPRKSATQCARETGVSSTSVRRILKAFKWNVYIPRVLHTINDDDPDHWMQFCEWFQQMVNEDEEFVTKIVWSDEAQYKLNGTVIVIIVFTGHQKIYTFMLARRSTYQGWMSGVDCQLEV